MSLAVFLRDPPAPEHLTELRALLDANIRLTVGPAPAVPADYEILVAGVPTPEQLAASPALHTLIIPWAGLPRRTRELLLDRSHLAVHNLHYNSESTAEMALTLMLAAAKFVVPLDRSLRSGDWTPRYEGDRSLLLDGKRVTLLGFGAIGRRVARACVALGMKVRALRRRSEGVAMVDGVEVHPPGDLRLLLPQADVLLICLPLTPQTTGLIGAAELARLPPKAILVNVGRGDIVVEQALWEALQSGSLYAAGIDVWYRYPSEPAARTQTLPSRFPFDSLDNVVMSPHRGGDNTETETRRMKCLAELLNCAVRGEPLPNRVDPLRGY